MLFVWGSRHYGSHDGVSHQHAMTRFGHLWFMPLFPIKAIWITEEQGRRGHPMSLTLRGVAHGYARAWGGICGLIAVVAGVTGAGVVAIAAGLAGLGLAGLSLYHRKLRSPRRRRAAEYTLIAAGTGCDPLDMPRDMAESIRGLAARRWEKAAGTLTVADVARVGAASINQAATAYTLARIDARIERGPKRRRARELSETILDATRKVSLDGTPYRDELPANGGSAATDDVR